METKNISISFSNINGLYFLCVDIKAIIDYDISRGEN